MRLHKLEIHNYKSLRNVAIEPTPLSVFVGPNAAGKTNLVDAIDFLGHAYSWGLERAVTYKGGYESICFRDMDKSKESIRFRVIFEVPQKRVFRRKSLNRGGPPPEARGNESPQRLVVVAWSNLDLALQIQQRSPPVLPNQAPQSLTHQLL